MLSDKLGAMIQAVVDPIYLERKRHGAWRANAGKVPRIEDRYLSHVMELFSSWRSP